MIYRKPFSKFNFDTKEDLKEILKRERLKLYIQNINVNISQNL